MKAFLDTSSLLKLYHSEIGSDRLSEILSEGIETIYLSELAKIEFLSAIWKKVRQKEITEEIANAVISCFEEDFGKYQWILLNPTVIKSAGGLIKKHGTTGLRTLDSIQLGCAVKLKDDDCVFFTSDKLLRKLFEKESLSTITYDQDISQ